MAAGARASRGNWLVTLQFSQASELLRAQKNFHPSCSCCRTGDKLPSCMFFQLFFFRVFELSTTRAHSLLSELAIPLRNGMTFEGYDPYYEEFTLSIIYLYSLFFSWKRSFWIIHLNYIGLLLNANYVYDFYAWLNFVFRWSSDRNNSVNFGNSERDATMANKTITYAALILNNLPETNATCAQTRLHIYATDLTGAILHIAGLHIIAFLYSFIESGTMYIKGRL